MSNRTLEFIQANAPLPDVGAGFFIEKFKDKIDKNTANYKDITVFLPTRGAARTLKNAIVSRLFKAGITNVLGLNIGTYEDYLGNFLDSKKAMTKLENFAIWFSIILNCNFDLIDALLPETKNISRKEVMHIAKEIMFLQQKLNENLISIKQASEKFVDSPDCKRWQNLAFLEEIYNYKVEELGKITQLDNLFDAIESASKSIENLLIIGNPDISLSLKFFVNKVGENGNVDIAVFASEADKELFDDFGAPKDLEYSSKALEIKEEDIYLCATPKDEALLVQDLAKSYGTEFASKALGIACEQRDNASIFKEALEVVKVNAISLEGNKLSQTSFFDLLKNIMAFLDTKSFEPFVNLTRNFFLINYIKVGGFSVESVQIQLDKIKANTACKDISSVISLLLESELDYLKDFRDVNHFIVKIFDFIKSINLGNLEEKILKLCEGVKTASEVDALEIFKTSLSRIFAVNENFYIAFEIDEVFSIIFEALEGTSEKIEKEKNSIVLQDWMEIFWSKAPHLLLCDMNDGIVPLRDNNGLFLNDSLREKLSMTSQVKRQARDAYMLECLLKSRASSSYKTSVLLSQNKIGGDPLVPSRILFQTTKAEIAQRVSYLFDEISPKASKRSAEKEWKLQVEMKAFDGNYSVSKFNDYLNSPWIFYLKNVLKMDIVDIEKDELDKATFGNLYHKILENFGNSKLKNSENSEEINRYFLRQLDEILTKDFANNERVQIKIQLEDLKSRLYHTAIGQAEHRAKGWEIICAEHKFKNYDLGDGVLLNGVFDRVDYHPSEGYLIIDYKTKSKVDNANVVEKSHRHIKKDKSVKWKNLQIPIYLEVFENLEIKTDKNASLNCAYFCATKDASSIGFYYWENAKDYVDEAKKEALDIAEKVRNKDFFDFKKEDEYKSFNSVFNLDFDILKAKVKESL